MSPRKAPTRDEIVAALDIHSLRRVGLGLDARAVPYVEAVEAVRAAFTTTRKMAQSWLEGGVVDGTPECPVLMVHGLDNGAVYSVLGPNVRHDGRSPRRVVADSPDSALVWTPFDTVGYDESDVVQLDHKGAYVSGGRPLDTKRRTSKDWVVLRSTFATMVAASRDDRAAASAKYDAKVAAEEVAFESVHPDALETLRALMAVADNPLRMSNIRVGASPRSGMTHATITLYDEDIDAVASFLRERGVTP